jgi:PAS domain S-box-containing protein
MSPRDAERRAEGQEPQSGGEDSLSSGRLRRRAEEIVQSQAPNLEALTAEALQDLAHELQVHQIELELQNQALRETQLALELARDEYAELYDHAPVGYVTVGGDGTITRANVAAASLFGVERRGLVGQPFRRFVARDDQDAYHFFRVRLEVDGRDTSELNLIRGAGSPCRVRLQGVVSGVDQEGRPCWRVALSDVTAEHEAREALRLVVEGTAPVIGHDFLRALVRHLARLLKVRYVVVGEFDDSRSRVRTDAAWAGEDWVENWTFDLRSSACAPAAAGRDSFYASGLRSRVPGDPFVARWKVDSARALPLRDVSGRVLGVLLAMDEAPMVQAPHLEPILTIFAERAAAELARLAAETRLERFSERQAALYAVAAALTTSLEPAALMEGVLGELVPLFGAAAAWIVAAGESRDDPRQAVASRGFGGMDSDSGELVAQLETWPTGPDLLEPRVAVHRSRVPGGWLERANLRGHVCLLLARHGEVVGWLHLAWHGERTLSKEEESLLLAIGDQVSLGLYNARLYHKARQVDRLRALADLDLSLLSSLDPEELAVTGLERMAAAVHASEALMLGYAGVLNRDGDRVLTLDEGWIQVKASARYRRWVDILEALSRQRQDLPGLRQVYATVAPWGSDVLVVPLDDDEPLADLLLAGHTFADEDVALARAAAGRVSQALRNARLHAEVHVLLREQQESLAQLVHSEKMGALGRLTASLSHEINNPLQALLGSLELAREELAGRRDDEEPVMRFLSSATHASKHIRALMERMRSVYRRDDGERVLGQVDEILEGVVALTHGELQQRRITIARILDPDLPAVLLNAGQLYQVLLNLILNAADAMPHGGNLTLRTGLGKLGRHPYEPRAAVRIDVQDTGAGISPAVRKRLFEPFFTTKEEGSGLGLYISQQIVRAHGGEIEAHSREGEGTTMMVWLPIAPLPGEDSVEEGA